MDGKDRAVTVRMAKMFATIIAIATNMDIANRRWNVTTGKDAVAKDPKDARPTDNGAFVRAIASEYFADLAKWKKMLAVLQPYYNEKLVDVTFYLRRETSPSVPGVPGVSANVTIDVNAIMDTLVSELESGKISAEEFATKTDALKMKF